MHSHMHANVDVGDAEAGGQYRSDLKRANSGWTKMIAIRWLCRETGTPAGSIIRSAGAHRSVFAYATDDCISIHTRPLALMASTKRSETSSATDPPRDRVGVDRDSESERALLYTSGHQFPEKTHTAPCSHFELTFEA